MSMCIGKLKILIDSVVNLVCSMLQFKANLTIHIRRAHVLKLKLYSHSRMGEMSQFTGKNAAFLKHRFDSIPSDSVKTTLSIESGAMWEEHVKNPAGRGNNLAPDDSNSRQILL